ncbi:MAG: DUF3617 family protein [Terracidiphilus sp.]|jgi:hypothetical protein
MMTYFKWAFLGLIVLMATAISSAQQTTASPVQQKFPLTPGEWIVTAPSTGQGQPPVVLSYCINDATWAKTIGRNHSCTITNYSTSSTGLSYNMSCTMNNFQMKGKVSMVFDGMTHMVGQGSFTMDSFKGGVTHSDTQTDYRWKGPTCDPNTDVNLKVGHPTDSEPEPKPVYRNHVDH